MEATSLKEIYASVNPDAKTIYVVPLIRFEVKKSDYLYLLYEELLNDDDYHIQPISVFNHFKLVFGLLKNRKQAILHYHWLEFQDMRSLAGMPWKIFCIYLFQKLGGTIVWTLHNEFPHDQKYLKLHDYLHNKMASWASILHVHCKKAVDIMSERLQAPKDKFRLVPHPDFPAFPVDKNKALQHLNDVYGCDLTGNQPVLLMFGNISRYKQIERVADIVINADYDCRLMIVGPIKKGNDDLYDELAAQSRRSDKIEVVAKFIPEEHVPWFYSASDYCIFHYREILSSGGYHMAKSYQKEIIAPDLGCLSEEGDQPNVHLFKDEEALKSELSKQLKPPENGR
ncbi:MAG: hypothetical protein CL666_07110 [Balneola sp.]|nr:hypothetical protein [Balneola sp.]|tara:strand:+ start:65679 stop:66701 length:1023 start_codon:yes stop_codon:yes gene_type:complete